MKTARLIKRTTLAVFIFSAMAMAGGTSVTDSILCPAYGGAQRYVGVYLPEGYAQDTDSTYPCVYFLHGAGGTVNPTSNFYTYQGPMLDLFISQGKIPKMIVVSVDGHSHRQHGVTWYTNSILNGNVEDHIINEVIPHVDAKYRTVKGREGRAIMGHSMGGYGTLKVGMKHADVFGALASQSGLTYFDKFLADVAHDKTKPRGDADSVVNWGQGLYYGMATAYSPNFASPDSIDIPFDALFNVIPEVRTRWLENDCYTLLDQYKTSLQNMYVYVDCGTIDELNFDSHARFIHDKMTALGIQHAFKLYYGDHCEPLDRGYVSSGDRTIIDAPRLDSNAAAFGLKAVGNFFMGGSPIRRSSLPVPSVSQVAVSTVGGSVVFLFPRLSSGKVALQAFDLKGSQLWGWEGSGATLAPQRIRWQWQGKVANGPCVVRVELPGKSVTQRLIRLE